jgi:hypothetical protein
MKKGLRLDRDDHTVCRVSFEDSYGNLHRTIVRIPQKVPYTHRNLVRLVEVKHPRKRIARIVGEECTTARRSKSHKLAR